MMKDLGDMMKQAKAMQENMQKMQEKIANTEVLGESGAGIVKITMTGSYDVKNVSLDPSLLSEDKEVIEDLVAAAINDAVRKLEATSKTKISDLAASFKLPPGFKMPF